MYGLSAPVRVKHIVLFKAKAEAQPTAIHGFFHEAKSLLQIPGVLDVQAGEQNSSIFEGYVPRTKGYTHALVVTLESAAALRTYAEHQDHLRFKNFVIAPNFVSEETCAIDFHFEDVKSMGNKSALPSWSQWSIAILAAHVAVLGGIWIGKTLLSKHN
jgi:hypothetical protein